MNLDEILDDTYLHATFHDATINKIELDYKNKKAIFHCQLLIGDPNSDNEEIRESKRLGQLSLSGLHYCVIEPPDPSYSYQDADGLWITSDGPLKGSDKFTKEKKLPSNLPENAFIYRFFISDWNAFIFFAAEQAVFKWLE